MVTSAICKLRKTNVVHKLSSAASSQAPMAMRLDLDIT